MTDARFRVLRRHSSWLVRDTSTNEIVGAYRHRVEAQAEADRLNDDPLLTGLERKEETR